MVHCSLVLPRVTLLSAVTGLNPEPVIVMVVPPYKDPRDGEKLVTSRTYFMVVLTPVLQTHKKKRFTFKKFTYDYISL